MTANDRVARMEEKVDKLDAAVGDVKVSLGRITERLDVVLDNHEKRICDHEQELKTIRTDLEKSKFLASTRSKILAILLALFIALVPVIANLTITRMTSTPVTTAQPVTPSQAPNR